MSWNSTPDPHGEQQNQLLGGTFPTTMRSMRRPPIRVLDLAGSPEHMGATHGATYADEIRQYTDERVLLSWRACGPADRWPRPTCSTSPGRCSPPTRPTHPRSSPRCAPWPTAGITPAKAVIVGGFTDFVDTVRAVVGGVHPETVMEDDCTSVIVPDHRADGAGFFAQTWDMHDSATEHVVLLRTDPTDAPAALVFTTTGASARSA